MNRIIDYSLNSFGFINNLHWLYMWYILQVSQFTDFYSFVWKVFPFPTSFCVYVYERFQVIKDGIKTYFKRKYIIKKNFSNSHNISSFIDVKWNAFHDDRRSLTVDSFSHRSGFLFMLYSCVYNITAGYL